MNTSTISGPEAIPFALDLLNKTSDKASLLRLVSEVCELARKHNILLPDWVQDYLIDAINQSRNNPAVDRADYILALLTLNLSHPDSALEAEATAIINRAYSSLKTLPSTTGDQLISSLYISSTFCDYVENLDITRIADTYKLLAGKLNIPLSPLQQQRLRAIYADNAPFLKDAPTPSELINRVILNAFNDYRTKGADSGIDPILLMTHLDDALNRRHDPAFFGAPLRWYAHTLEQWVNLTLTPRFDRLPAPRRREIVRHLLHTDLYPVPVSYKHHRAPQ
ncbi:MAG: hypothetical protein K2H46_00205, partial [Muribaculaceae bacterium]|nr:hypothetical protein [Muribaculaceae bacterium]